MTHALNAIEDALNEIRIYQNQAQGEAFSHYCLEQCLEALSLIPALRNQLQAMESALVVAKEQLGIISYGYLKCTDGKERKLTHGQMQELANITVTAIEKITRSNDL